MSRDPEEVNKLTENTYKNVMEQFNPGLRNLINLGKNYEKAVNVMVVAGRAYYDSLAKIGDISADSPVSKELGCLQKAELLLSNYRAVKRNGCAECYEIAEKGAITVFAIKQLVKCMEATDL